MEEVRKIVSYLVLLRWLNRKVNRILEILLQSLLVETLVLDRFGPSLLKAIGLQRLRLKLRVPNVVSHLKLRELFQLPSLVKKGRKVLLEK